MRDWSAAAEWLIACAAGTDEQEVRGEEVAFLSEVISLSLRWQCGWLWFRMQTGGTPRWHAEGKSAVALQADQGEVERLEKPFAKVQAVVCFLCLL